MRVELSRPGLASKDNVQADISVPDATGGIGPQHYFEAVNGRLALYDRGSLRLVTSRDAGAFWGVPNIQQGITADPQVTWDRLAHRWYYEVHLNNPFTNRHALVFAWSRQGDPTNLTSGWCRMRIDTGSVLDDFAHVSYTSGGIVIAANTADLVTKQLLFSRVWVIAKPGASCRRPAIRQLTVRRVGGRVAVTLIPVVPARPSAVGYVVAAECVDGDPSGEPEASCPRTGSKINVWKVTGLSRAPRLGWVGAVPVGSYRVPTAVALRGGWRLDSSDTRLLGAVSAPDPSRHVPLAIWTANTVAGTGGRAVVRWFEIDPRGPRLLQQGRLSQPDRWVFNPAISPTGRGDAAVITYNVAGGSMLPVIRARLRTARTPRGVMTGETTLARSLSADPSCDAEPTECRWGDYAGAVPDPLRPNVVWGSNEMVGRSIPGIDHWASQNFAIAVR